MLLSPRSGFLLFIYLFMYFLSFGLSTGQEVLPFPATFAGLENFYVVDSIIILFHCWFPKPRILFSQVQPRVQKCSCRRSGRRCQGQPNVCHYIYCSTEKKKKKRLMLTNPALRFPRLLYWYLCKCLF